MWTHWTSEQNSTVSGWRASWLSGAKGSWGEQAETSKRFEGYAVMEACDLPEWGQVSGKVQESDNKCKSGEL